MSRWTHVSGIIRVDGLAGIKEPDFDKLFKVAYWDQPKSWDHCNMPCGSEGSLKYKVEVNPDPTCLARYVVTIWGDLRDYGDEKQIFAIEHWFRGIVKKLDLVRMAVMEVIEDKNENNCILVVTGNNNVRNLQFKENIQ